MNVSCSVHFPGRRPRPKGTVPGSLLTLRDSKVLVPDHSAWVRVGDADAEAPPASHWTASLMIGSGAVHFNKASGSLGAAQTQLTVL